MIKKLCDIYARVPMGRYAPPWGVSEALFPGWPWSAQKSAMYKISIEYKHICFFNFVCTQVI